MKLMTVRTKQAKIKISPTGKAILDLLRSRGGSSNVGAIDSNRNLTVKNLRLLESAGLIERLDAPDTENAAESSDCGVWKLSDSPDPERKFRSCGFCGLKALYDEFPDGSVCFEGVCACADCLQTERTATFRLLLDEERIAYNKRFRR